MRILNDSLDIKLLGTGYWLIDGEAHKISNIEYPISLPRSLFDYDSQTGVE